MEGRHLPPTHHATSSSSWPPSSSSPLGSHPLSAAIVDSALASPVSSPAARRHRLGSNVPSALASGPRPSARTATPAGFSQPSPRRSLGSNCRHRLDSNVERSTSATAAAPSSSPSCASLRSSSWLSSSWKRHLPSPPRSPWPPGGYGPLVHGHAARSDRDRHRAGADTPRARRFSL